MSDNTSPRNSKNDENGSPLFSRQSVDLTDFKPWILRTENIVASLFSAAWLGLAADFLAQTGWWDARYDMTPPEYVGFLAGLLMPLALIWFVVIYFAGHKRYDDEAVRLRNYLRQFIQPSPKDKLYVKSLLTQISDETQALNNACKSAQDNVRRIVDGLGETLSEMRGLSEKFDDSLLSASALVDEKIAAFAKEAEKTASQVRENASLIANALDSLETAGDKAREKADGIHAFLADALTLLNDAHAQIGERTRAVADEVREQTRLLTHAGETAQELMSAQTERLVQTASAQNASLAQTAQSVRELMTEQAALIKTDFTRQSEELTQMQERLQDNVASLTLLVDEQTDKLAQATQNAMDGAARIGRDLTKATDNLCAVFDEQADRFDERDAQLNDTASKVLENFQKQNALLDEETKTVLSRFKVIESSLENYVGEISGVSDDAHEKIGAAAQMLNEKAAELSSLSARSQQTLTEWTDSLTAKGDVLEARAKSLAERSAVMADVMTDAADKMSGVLDGAAQKVKSYVDEVSGAADVFASHLDDCGEKTKDLTTGLNQKMSELSDLSAALKSQSGVTEASLNRQQKYLDAAAANVEQTKDALKQQAQTLFDLADALDGKTRQSIENLAERLSQTVEQVGDVLDKIGQADVTLARQTDGLNGAAGKIGAVGDGLNEMLQRRAADFNETQNLLKERSDALAAEAERRTALIAHGTEKLCAQLQKSLDEMQARFDALCDNAHGFIDGADAATVTMNDKAAYLGELLVRQQNRLTETSDKLSAQAADVSELLRRQSEQAEADLERLAPRVRLLQEGLDVQTKELSAATETALGKLESVGKNLTKQADELTGMSDSLKERLTGVSDLLAEKTALFDTSLKASAAGAVEAAEQMERCHNEFKETAEQLKTQVDSLDERITAQTDALQKHAAKSTQQAIMVRDAMQRQITELTDVANVVSAQSRLGESALTQQTRYLREAAEEVMTHIRNINEAVRQNTNDLLGASSRIGFELDAMGENLRQRNEEAASAASDSLERSTKAAAFLQEKAAILAEVAQTVVSSMQKTGQVFAEQTAQMQAAGSMARDELTATGDSFLVQSYQLNRISEDAQKAVKGLSVSLRERAADFTKMAESSAQSVRLLKDAVSQIETEFEEMSNKGVIQIDLAGQRLRSMIGEIASNSERIALEVRKSGEQFVEQSDVLSQAADTAVGRLDDLLGVMKENAATILDTGDKISAQSLKLGGAFGRQVQALLDASKGAQDYIEDLEKRKQDASVTHFMKDATFITEHLQSFGVDIARLFDPNVEADLWKRYYNGDRSAFVRYLSRSLDKQQIRKLSELFAKNAEFRDYVSKYTAEFDTLLRKARETERGDVLSDVLLSSDAGRLYMLLGNVFSN